MQKILLVEDDLSLSRGVSFRLKKEGYEVFTATKVSEALEIFNNNKIDLVISDVGFIKLKLKNTQFLGKGHVKVV